MILESICGLSQDTQAKIKAVFARYSTIEKVVLYGSRAKGTFKPGSDIDLTLFGPTLDLNTQFQIESDLDDLYLPYKVDLSIFSQIDNPALKEHIERVGIVF